MAKSRNLLLTFAGGVAAGWLISLFMSTEIKTKTKKAIQKDAEKLKDILTNQENRERVAAIFDDVTQKTTNTYKTAQSKLISGLTSLKYSLEEIDKDKYQQVVNQIIKDLQDNEQINLKQAKKLKTYLVADFELIKSHIQPESTEEKPKKTRKAAWTYNSFFTY